MIEIFKKLVNKKLFFFILFIRFILSLYNLSVAFFIKLIFDEIFSKNFNKMYKYMIILMITTLVYSYLLYFYRIILEKMNKSILETTSTNIIEKFLKFNTLDINQGKFISLINEDIINFSSFLMYGFFPIFEFILILLFGIVYVSYFSIKSAIFYLIIGIGFLIYSKINYNIAYSENDIYLEKDDYHKLFFEKIIKSVAIIKVFNIGSWIKFNNDKIFDSKMTNYKKISKALSKTDSILSGGIYLVQILSFILGMVLVKNNEFSLSEMISIWNLGISSIIYVFLDLPSIFSYMLSQRSSFDRLEKFLVENKENEYNNYIIDKKIKGILGNNISFSYSGKEIFNNFNFLIKDNNINYIIGKNGSGKTTLIKLILNELKLDSGNILINKENVSFSYIPQKIELFSCSILENITYGRNNKLEKILYFIDKLNLSNKIKSLKNGIETIYSEDCEFSGGELRRIALIRGLISESDYLILDEPFSDLDIDNILNLKNILKDYSKEKTVIIISHQLELIESDDNVIRVGEIYA